MAFHDEDPAFFILTILLTVLGVSSITVVYFVLELLVSVEILVLKTIWSLLLATFLKLLKIVESLVLKTTSFLILTIKGSFTRLRNQLLNSATTGIAIIKSGTLQLKKICRRVYDALRTVVANSCGRQLLEYLYAQYQNQRRQYQIDLQSKEDTAQKTCTKLYDSPDIGISHMKETDSSYAQAVSNSSPSAHNETALGTSHDLGSQVGNLAKSGTDNGILQSNAVYHVDAKLPKASFTKDTTQIKESRAVREVTKDLVDNFIQLSDDTQPGTKLRDSNCTNLQHKSVTASVGKQIDTQESATNARVVSTTSRLPLPDFGSSNSKSKHESFRFPKTLPLRFASSPKHEKSNLPQTPIKNQSYMTSFLPLTPSPVGQYENCTLPNKQLPYANEEHEAQVEAENARLSRDNQKLSSELVEFERIRDSNVRALLSSEERQRQLVAELRKTRQELNEIVECNKRISQNSLGENKPVVNEVQTSSSRKYIPAAKSLSRTLPDHSPCNRDATLENSRVTKCASNERTQLQATEDLTTGIEARKDQPSHSGVGTTLRLEKQIESLSTQFHNAQKEIAQHDANLKSCIVECERHKAYNIESKTLISKYENDIKDLTEKLQTSSHNSEHEHQIQLLQEEKSLALARAEDAEALSTSFQLEVGALEKEINLNRKEQARQKAGFENQLAAANSRQSRDINSELPVFRDLTNKHERAVLDRDLAQGQLLQVELLLQQSVNELSQLKAEAAMVQNYKEAIDEACELRKRASIDHQRIEMLTIENQELHRVLDRKADLSVSQQQRIDQLEKDADLSASQQQRIEQLEKDAADAQIKAEEIDDLYKEIMSDNSKSEEEIEKLNSALEEENSRHHKLEAELRDEMLHLNSEHAAQRAKDAAAHGQIQVKMMDQVRQLQLERDNLLEEKESHAGDFEASQNALKDLSVQRNVINQQLQALQHENQFLNKKIEDRDHHVANLEDELNKVEDMKVENQKLRGYLNQIQPQVDNFSELMKQNTEDLQRRHSIERESLEKELKGTKGLLKQTQLQRDEHQKSASNLNQQLINLKNAPPVSDEQLRQQFEAKFKRQENELQQERVARMTAQVRAEDEIKKRLAQTPSRPDTNMLSIPSSPISPSYGRNSNGPSFPSATQKKLDRQVELTRKIQAELDEVKGQMEKLRYELALTMNKLEGAEKAKEEELNRLRIIKDDEILNANDELALKVEEMEHIQKTLTYESKLKENAIEALNIQMRTLVSELQEARSQLPAPPSSPGKKKRVHDETDSSSSSSRPESLNLSLDRVETGFTSTTRQIAKTRSHSPDKSNGDANTAVNVFATLTSNDDEPSEQSRAKRVRTQIDDFDDLFEGDIEDLEEFEDGESS